MFTVYILYSAKLDLFYKGQTSNLDNRLMRHNSGYEKFTMKGIPWTLIWKTTKENRSQAVVLKKKLKNLGRIDTINFIQEYKLDVVGPNEHSFSIQIRHPDKIR